MDLGKKNLTTLYSGIRGDTFDIICLSKIPLVELRTEFSLMVFLVFRFRGCNLTCSSKYFLSLEVEYEIQSL